LATFMKFQRNFDSDIIDFQVLSRNWEKLTFLRSDRKLDFHTKSGLYYQIKLPEKGCDLTFDRKKLILYIPGVSNKVAILDLNNGKFINEIKSNENSGITCSGLNNKNGLFVVGMENGKNEFWDPRILKKCIGKLNNFNYLKYKKYNSVSSLRFNDKNDNNINNFCLFNSWISLFVNNGNIRNIFEKKYGEKNFPNQKIAQNFFSNSRLLISQGKVRTESKLSLKKEGVLINLFPFPNISKRSRRFFFVKYKSGDDDFFCLDALKKFGKVKNFYFFFRTNMIIVGYKKSSDAKLAFKQLQKRLVGEEGRLINWIPLHFEKKKKFSSECNDINTETNLKIRNNSLTFKSTSKKSKSFEMLSIKNNLYKKVVNWEKTPIKDFGFNIGKKNINSFCFFSGKLIVRNIPFKTKINNLKKIFSIFGKILSIRLPKGKNGENRGFAFVKYNHLNDAKKALYFVQNTKIDSRSLRIILIN